MTARQSWLGRLPLPLLQTGLVLLVLTMWEAVARLFPTPAFPPFTAVIQSTVAILTDERLLNDVIPSALRVLVGFTVGVAVGVVIGLIMGYFRHTEPWFRPLLEFLRAIPTIALIPAALLIFGPTESMRVGLIAFSAFFPVLLSTIDGARRVDGLLIDTSRIIGLSRSESLRRVILPAALPAIFAGIRVALGIALIVMVIAELTAASSGIGYQIQQSQRLFRTVDVFGGTLIIGLLGYLFTISLLAVERRVLRWHAGWRGATVK